MQYSGRKTRPEADAGFILATQWETDASGRPRLPIDPVQIARSLDVEVFTAGMEAVAGMLVKKSDGIPKIYVNQFDSPSRQRFTCAHELGHYVRRDSSDQEWEYIDRRDDISSTGTNAEEIYANQFAAALLMPAALVQDLSDYYTPIEMAREFGVSVSAMTHRLSNLGMR